MLTEKKLPLTLPRTEEILFGSTDRFDSNFPIHTQNMKL